MPQTNVIPDWKLTYPNDAKAMKPTGMIGTVSRTASAAAWAAGVVTLTVPAITDPVGAVIPITVSGFTPGGYNGSFSGVVASSTTVKYSVASDPGTATVMGSMSYPGIVPIAPSTTLPGTAVPNKPTYAAGTIQSASLEQAEVTSSEEEVEEIDEEEEEEE
jgi:hypothetical protein